MNVFKILLIAISTLFLSFNLHAQEWNILGPTENQMPSSGRGVGYISISSDQNGIPYVAFQDGGSNNKISVRKYNASNKTWEPLGPQGFSDGMAYYVSMAIDRNNVPYVIYRDDGNGGKAIVKRFNGTVWEAVGGGAVSLGNAIYAGIAFTATDIPYVVFRDADNKAYVKRLVGATWQTVDGGSISGLYPSYLSLAIDQNDVYVAYQDYDKANKATVKKFNGTTWVALEAEGFSMGVAAYTNLTIGSDHSPYIVYQDANNSNKATVQKFNSLTSKWAVVGTLGFSPGTAASTVIAVDNSDIPVIVYRDGNQGNKASMCRYNVERAAWETISSGFSSGPVSFTSITRNSSGKIYFAYSDEGLGYQGVVQELSNTDMQWKNVGSINASGGSPSAYTTITSGGTADFYMAYQDADNFNKATVKRYNSGTLSWEILGTAGFSDGASAYLAVTSGPANIPYVIYQDGSKENKATVKWYKSATSSWETAGVNGFSSGDVSYTKIALDAAGVPFVVYSDASLSGKAVVRKFNVVTNNWDILGTEGFSDGSATYASIAMDAGGVPYVAYRDGANGNKLTVKRYNALAPTQWETVGIVGFSSGAAAYIGIAFDHNNVLYVVYQDAANSNRVTVKRYNSLVLTWETVGTEGFTYGSSEYTSIAIAPNDVPYVAYRDGANSSKLTVKRYQNSLNAWETVGTEGLSAGPALYSSLSFNASGKLAAAYTDGNYSNRPVVQQLNVAQGNWLTLGSSGISSNSVATDIALAVNATDIPYVIYQDSGDGDKAKVKRFNATTTSWESQGAALSSGAAAYTDINIAPDGIPYASFSDAGSGDKVTVKSFDGTSWVPVGALAVSSGAASYAKIKVPENAKPYIIYRDAANANKATAKRWNGTTWEALQIEGFSAGEVTFTDIAVDQAGVVYAAYSDATLAGKLTVRSFNGTNWTTISTATGLSIGQASFIAIEVDAANIPYVAYQDAGNSGKLMVKKYNGVSWDVVGGGVVSTGNASHIDLAMAAVGQPYVIYRDGSKSDRATVKSLVSGAWQEVAAEGFSSGAVSFNSLVISNSGKIYAAYRDENTGGQAVALRLNQNTQSWQDVSGAVFSGLSSITALSTSLDKNNNPIVVYQDERNGRSATAKRYKVATQTWENLGVTGFTQGVANFVSIASDQANTPYVVYQDLSVQKKVTVMKYNGTVWTELGTKGFSDGIATYTTIAIDRNNMPYVAYQDSTKGYKAMMKHYVSGTWEALGADGLSASRASFISMAIDNSDIPYVAYRDSSKANKLTVKRYIGNTWQTIGTEGFSAGQVSYISLTFDRNNVLSVVYVDAANGGRATVQQYNGTTWTTIGTAGFSFGSATYPSLAFDNSNVPYVSYRDAGNLGRTTVQRYNALKLLWEVVGVPGFSMGDAYYNGILAATDASMYVLYRDNGASGRAIMKKLNEQAPNWDVLGVNGLSEGYPVNYTAVATGADGTPYTIYQDGKSGKAVVKKYNKTSSSWENLGGSPLSSGAVAYTDISVSTSNIPYVVYQDATAANKAIVKKFNGTAWVDEGTTVSGGASLYSKIDLDAANIPYVVYRDATASNKAVVKKFNGTTWESVGGTPVSDAAANYTAIAISPGNNPYIVYQDNSANNKATVKRFNGAAWEVVGNAGISMGIASYTDIAIGTDNVPWIVYQDAMNGNRATVQYYNSITSKWEIAGTLGFSPGAVIYTSIAIDAANIPYITYLDGSQGNRTSVRRYNKLTRIWELVGNSPLSLGAVAYTSIAINSVGEIYTAFQDAGLANQVVVKKLNTNLPVWEPMGVSGLGQGSGALYTTVEVDYNKTPYLVYADAANGNRAVARRYNKISQSWETIGASGISLGSAAFTTLSTGPDNKPVLAYQDGGNYNKLSAKKFNTGTNTWETLGVEGFSQGIVSHVSSVVDGNNIPYIVYVDDANGSKVEVQKWNGATWSSIGNVSPNPAAYADVAMDNNNVPYVAFQERITGGKTKLTVKRYTGTAWENVGTDAISAKGVSFVALAIDRNNIPYVSYQDSSQSNGITVKRFSGATWEALGGEGISDATVSFLDLKIDHNNIPYILYTDFSKSRRATVKRFVGSQWQTVGDAGFSRGAVSYNAIGIDSDGKVYAAYCDQGNNNTPTVRMLDNKAYFAEIKGESGLSSGSAVSYTQIVLDKNNIPYVIYSDGGKVNAATVRRFSNSKWELVGPRGFSPGSVAYTSLAIAKDESIYAAYRDGASGNRAVVKKYNSKGNSWLTIGTEGFSTGAASYVNIAVASNNTPYVIYQDEWNSKKVTVKRLSGSQWQTVGNIEGFSSGEAHHTTIAIDKSNTPYIVYSDWGNGSKAVVQKFNGTTWQSLGTVSAGSADYTNITIDQNNIIYVVYRDLANGNKATVKRYNGTSWEDVGSGMVSVGAVANTSIYVDQYNIPYVVYLDGVHNSKVTVQRYNPIRSRWEVVGQPGFSTISVEYPSLAIGKDNAPYVVYSSGQAFARNYTCTLSITQPANISVCKDTEAEFRVAVSGTDNSYQWQVNDGSGFKNLIDDANYSGVNSDLLKINSAPIAYNGYKYRCLVIGCSVLMSNEVTLSVTDFTPKFTSGSVLPIVRENKKYEYAFTATDGVGPYTYSLTSGTLPEGLSISSDGKITGKATKGTTGDYTITVQLTESSACRNTTTATFNLKVEILSADLVDIHPVITPNGDGMNDVLTIEGIESYPENRVVLFNRNGTPVYEMKQYDNQQRAFKGKTTYGSDFLPAGTYYYILEFKADGKWERKTGYFILKF